MKHPIPIYAISYSSDYSDGDWIQPGVYDEFYSISIDHLNGYEYFSVYYDSLIVFLKDHEDQPVKFYKDGKTINYDPRLNPFTNPDVWQTRAFNRHLPGSSFESLEEKQIYEDYFSIEVIKNHFTVRLHLNRLRSCFLKLPPSENQIVLPGEICVKYYLMIIGIDSSLKP